MSIRSMLRIRGVAAAVIAVPSVGGLVWAAPAVAAAPTPSVPIGAVTASLSVSPKTVVRGHTVTVTGRCEPNTVGYVISTAFYHDASHDFAGVGAETIATNIVGEFSATPLVPTSIAPGEYVISARCGGGNIGVTAKLQVLTPGPTVLKPPTTAPPPPPTTPAPASPAVTTVTAATAATATAESSASLSPSEPVATPSIQTSNDSQPAGWSTGDLLLLLAAVAALAAGVILVWRMRLRR